MRYKKTLGPKIKYPDIHKRFRQTYEDSGLSLKAFGELLGESENNVKQIVTGRNAPSIDVMRKWSKNFKKSYKWIIDGE